MTTETKQGRGMSANHKPVQRTHFADDATLAYIAQLERDRARLIAALDECKGALHIELLKHAAPSGYYESSGVTVVNNADALLRELDRP